MKAIIFIIVSLFAVYCSKEKGTCGKITNVNVNTYPSKKDTVRISFMVQFTPTDTREFVLLKNQKKHPSQFWYDYIGKQHCIGDQYPD